MKSIVIIDDDPVTLENTAEILELANFKVYTALNGKDGISLIQKEIPDLIICDIHMPELDGYGVLHILNKNPQTAVIPFIFLTSRSSTREIRRGMGLGADDYITKPFEDAELLASIEARLLKSEHLKRGFQKYFTKSEKTFATEKEIEEWGITSAGRRSRAFKKKENIYMEGDEANYIYLINKGKIKTYKSNKYGKELITGVHQSGAFIGTLDLIDNKEYRESAVAIENSELTIIPKQDFYTLIYSNRDLAVRFIHLLSNDIYEMADRLLGIAYDSVRRRVAEGLLIARKKFLIAGTTDSFVISRENFAGMVCISPETVSRTLHEFIDEELISMENKKIKILNEQKLKNMKG